MTTSNTESASRVPIRTSTDIVICRQRARELAAELGFKSTDATLIATAVSELARNIVRYAGEGTISLEAIHNGNQHGILMIASDKGPGIADIHQALRDGFSSSGSLGLGLPGVRRLMDDFEIESEVGKGTTVKAAKWIDR